MSEIVYKIPIISNNKNTAKNISMKIYYDFIENGGAKKISTSFTETQNEYLLLLPYALLKIVAEEGDSKLKKASGENAWMLTIDYEPVPEDINSSTNLPSIDEVQDALNELKK